MAWEQWAIYLALVLAATATPGPAVLFIMTNATLHGWQKALFIALGNVLGLLSLGVVAVTGLGALLQASEVAFGIVKYIGAAYLIYLGIKMLRSKGLHIEEAHHSKRTPKVSTLKLFSQAYFVAVSNPKAIVFLTALFPQFIDMQMALLPQFVRLIATLMFFSFSFLMGYALLAHQAKEWLSHPARAKRLSQTSGGIFVGLGLMLAGSSSR
jgi:threonine/homoserine/homoserine lactone efflux protein